MLADCDVRHSMALQRKETTMNLTRIRTIAIQKGVNPGKLNKTDLIRTIQRTEGLFDCYATAYQSICDQLGCAWREDCFAEARKATS
jgi:hypothetical protein